MKNPTSAKLLVLKDKLGQPLRMIQSHQSSLSLVQNIETKRIELVDSDLDFKDTHTLLQVISLDTSLETKDTKKTSINLKGIGTLFIYDKGIYDEGVHAQLDPRPLKEEEQDFSQIIKWSSGVHGFALGFLILLSFLIPDKKPTPSNNLETLVTIQLDKPTPTSVPPAPPKPKLTTPPAPQVIGTKQVARVVPRTNKSKPLVVTKRAKSPKVRSPKTFAANNPSTQFQRLGGLGAIAHALKGARSGMGSGLRGAGGGTGGIGKGAGMGRGNGTMGHGNDSGGGYAQALYGKGLIAGQVGGGGGGFGSGWGEGTRGAGGFGTKGKGGGHQGYGNSKVGSGASEFSYPLREDAVVEGGLDREAVDLVVLKNIGQIIYCYELGLQQKSGLRGRVLIDFTINGKGRVSNCSVSSSSLRSAQVETCMMNKIKTWKFPQPAGGVNVDVNYPFALQRVSQN
jgi:TonB family protein